MYRDLFFIGSFFRASLPVSPYLYHELDFCSCLLFVSCVPFPCDVCWCCRLGCSCSRPLRSPLSVWLLLSSTSVPRRFRRAFRPFSSYSRIRIRVSLLLAPPAEYSSGWCVAGSVVASSGGVCRTLGTSSGNVRHPPFPSRMPGTLVTLLCLSCAGNCSAVHGLYAIASVWKYYDVGTEDGMM